MINTNEYPVIHDDFGMYIRTALVWVASPTFINDQPDDVSAFERGFILENPYPPLNMGCWAIFTQTKPMIL